MKLLGEIAKNLQWGERIVPLRWRLPLRYHVQRLVGALEPEMQLLDELVQPGDVAVDVGANNGIYTYALASRGVTVHCFEPLLECCSYIEAYRSVRITVHRCALSDAPGTLRLYVPTKRGQPVHTRSSFCRPEGAFDTRDVEVCTLDSFNLDRVAFIKIDVEGAEHAVLRGSRATLARHRPGLLVEIDHRRHSRESFNALLEWLRSLDYEPYVLDRPGLRPCTDPWADAARYFNFVFRVKAAGRARDA